MTEKSALKMGTLSLEKSEAPIFIQKLIQPFFT